MAAREAWLPCLLMSCTRLQLQGTARRNCRCSYHGRQDAGCDARIGFGLRFSLRLAPRFRSIRMNEFAAIASFAYSRRVAPRFVIPTVSRIIRAGITA